MGNSGSRRRNQRRREQGGTCCGITVGVLCIVAIVWNNLTWMETSNAYSICGWNEFRYCDTGEVLRGTKCEDQKPHELASRDWKNLNDGVLGWRSICSGTIGQNSCQAIHSKADTNEDSCLEWCCNACRTQTAGTIWIICVILSAILAIIAAVGGCFIGL